MNNGKLEMQIPKASNYPAHPSSRKVENIFQINQQSASATIDVSLKKEKIYAFLSSYAKLQAKLEIYSLLIIIPYWEPRPPPPVVCFR